MIEYIALLTVLCFVSLTQVPYLSALSIPTFGYYHKDADIQNTLVGITLTLDRRTCPVVVIHDEVLPKPALNRILSQFRSQNQDFPPRSSPPPSIFIIMDLSPPLNYIASLYNTSDPAEIILKFLHTLYRRSECYTFIIWIQDPKILEFSSTTTINPGWRENDIVLLPTHHTTKLYRSLTSHTFWNDIPNILGLKRKYDGAIFASSEIRVYTVIPYYFKKRQRKSQELDVWLVNERRFLYNRPLFINKFTKFNGAPITVGVYWKEPFMIFGDVENPYVDGLDWRLLGLCQKQLNFTLVLKSARSFGRPHGENGSWTGMMGNLRNNIINIGIGGVVMYSERMQEFGFTKPYYTDKFSFISPLSTTASSTWNALIFQPLVWQVAFCTMIFSSVVLKLVAELQYNLEENFWGNSVFTLKNIDRVMKKTLRPSHFRKMANVVGFILTVLCQKPYKHNPTRLAEQFVFYGISLGNFIMGIVFSSCLIAYLFQFKHKPLADKLADILHARVQVNFQYYDGYLEYFMETSKDPIIRNIYKVSVPVMRNGSEVNSTSSVDNVVRGKSIHIDSTSRLKFTGKYRYKGKKGIKFHMGSENLIDHIDIGWPVRKNWPFTKKFDDIINRAVENGFIQHWMRRLMQGKFGWDDEAYKIPELYASYLHARERRVKDLDPSLILDQDFIPLSITHLNGVFYVYLTGILLAFFAFLGEVLISVLHRTGKFVRITFHSKSKKQLKLSRDKTTLARKKYRNKVFLKLNVSWPKRKLISQQISANDLDQIFKIHKIKGESLFNDKHAIAILWSDFDQCNNKFGKIKLNDHKNRRRNF